MAEGAGIPVSEIYGTPGGCLLYKAGGVPALMSRGEEFAEVRRSIEESDILMLVRPSDILTPEQACMPKSADGDKLTLSCIQPRVSRSEMTATVSEDRTAGTVVYSDDKGSVTLKRCADQ